MDRFFLLIQKQRTPKLKSKFKQHDFPLTSLMQREILVYYALEKELWTRETYATALALLPPVLTERITAYQDERDKQNRLCSKLMLQDMLSEFPSGMNLSLNNLHYTHSGRPKLSSDLDINISHSGNLVVCIAALHKKVGIDTEEIKPCAWKDYETYFQPEEWDQLLRSSSPYSDFYTLWTRKEALLKATGQGIFTDFSASGNLSAKNRNAKEEYFIQKLEIDPAYITHLAASFPAAPVRLKHWKPGFATIG